MQPTRFRFYAAALAAVLATPLAAQEAEAPAADAAPAAEAPAAPAAETPAAEAPADGAAPAAPAGTDGAVAPAAGGAAPAEPEVMEVIRETHGDWQIRCAPEGEECFMYQLTMDAGNNPVAEVSILKLPAGAGAEAGVTVVTPLGTLLPDGVRVQIDTGEVRQYPFAWCSQVGCFARFGLDLASIQGMKRGRSGSIVLHSIAQPEEPVTLSLSLTGFTAAYDSLAVPTQPAAPAAPAASGN